jgi:hypothetical protein
MRDEQFEVADKFGRDKAEQQAEIHAEALRRAAERNSGPTGTVSETTDAQLNWAAGDGVISVGRGDVPFGSSLAEVAGISGHERLGAEAPPSSHGLTSVPDCSAGSMNMEAILRGRK